MKAFRRISALVALASAAWLAACARPSPAAPAPKAEPALASGAPAAAPPSSPSAPAFVRLGETAWKPFSAWKLDRDGAPDVDVYVAGDGAPKPTILLLPGSKCYPLFWILPGRQISALFLQGAVPGIVDEVNVVAFDRRGLKSFGPPPKSEEEAKGQAVCTAERGGISKTERVDDAFDVAEALLAQPWVSKLWVLGHSAGGDVAAGLAKRLGERVAAVGLFAGAGITRFFETGVRARREGGSAAAAKVFDDLLLATGPNPPAEVDGDPLLTVQTYALDSTPLDDLRGLRVPVFVAQGDADDKTPVEAADAFVAELLRERERSVYYALFPGCDHGFVDTKGRDRSEEALRAFVDWAGGGTMPRGVRVMGP